MAYMIICIIAAISYDSCNAATRPCRYDSSHINQIEIVHTPSFFTESDNSALWLPIHDNNAITSLQQPYTRRSETINRLSNVVIRTGRVVNPSARTVIQKRISDFRHYLSDSSDLPVFLGRMLV